MKWLLVLALLAGCKPAAHDNADPTLSAEDQVYNTLAPRLKTFAPDGFIITLANGVATEQGNSLLFTSIAAAALACPDGVYITAAMQNMLTSTGGSLYHHPSIPTQMDFDDAVGFYRGVAERIRHCNDTAAWLPGLKLNQALAPTINKAGAVTLAYPFTWLQAAVFNQAGLAGAPSDTDQALMETAVVGWATTDVAAKAACFRLHLGLQIFQTEEATGHTVSANARNEFCAVTAGADVPTLDHWCGRGDLKGYIDTFQENVWQYRHQRCGAWESPDGAGAQQPGVDGLIAYRDFMTGEE